MAAQWEYRVKTFKFTWKGFKWAEMEEELNGLGRDGWEVLSTLAPSQGTGQALEIAAFLKRPLAGS